jgi:hypothetical protein
MRLRIRADTWWQALPRHRRLERARVAQLPARRIDEHRVGEHRVGELAVGQEGALGAGDDAHGQPGAARRLHARDRQQQGVARSPGRHAVEQQVVDRAGQHHRLEVRAGQLGQRAELVGRFVVAGPDEPRGELVERRLGARGPHGCELGGQREGEVARSRAPAAGLEGEGHYLLGNPNTNCNGRE